MEGKIFFELPPSLREDEGKGHINYSCLGGRSSDLIISTADELQKAKPVTEGIAHHSDAPPSERLNLAFKAGAGRQRALHRGWDIVDLEVQVDGCPVAPIVAGQRNKR
jgi:hypothetical protein